MDEELTLTHQNRLYLNFLQSAFNLGLFHHLDSYIEIFFNHKLYTDVKSLKEFNEQVATSTAKENALIETEKERLAEHQYPLKPRLPKVSEEEELKMLDENEVKQQILRKHYNKMVQYYTKLITIIKTGMKKESFEKYISTKYEQLLYCQR